MRVGISRNCQITLLFFVCFNCLKLFDSSRVNPLQKTYIFMLLSLSLSLSLWLLFPLNAFIRTADCNCHPREYIDVLFCFFFQIFGYSKIIMK